MGDSRSKGSRDQTLKGAGSGHLQAPSNRLAAAFETSPLGAAKRWSSWPLLSIIFLQRAADGSAWPGNYISDQPATGRQQGPEYKKWPWEKTVSLEMGDGCRAQ